MEIAEHHEAAVNQRLELVLTLTIDTDGTVFSEEKVVQRRVNERSQPD